MEKEKKQIEQRKVEEIRKELQYIVNLAYGEKKMIPPSLLEKVIKSL